MPRNRNTNTLGNVGSLLQDAVDTTEDLALRDSICAPVSQHDLMTPCLRRCRQ